MTWKNISIMHMKVTGSNIVQHENIHVIIGTKNARDASKWSVLLELWDHDIFLFYIPYFVLHCYIVFTI